VTSLDNLVSTDPPVMASTDPVNNAINVPLNKIIKIVFNEQILPSDNYNDITLTQNGIDVPIITNIRGNTLIVNPLANYLGNTTYNLNIPVNSLKDLAGNIGGQYNISFTTFIPLALVSSDPVNNTVNVVGNKVITVTFNKPIKKVQHSTSYH